MAQVPHGLYFEDYEIGQEMVTRGRTITEADIVAFGSLTGDFNPMHFDAHYMQSHLLGQRVAHGMLTLSYAVGQAYQLGFMERTVLAFRALEMKFSQPVYIGDTVYVHMTIADLKPADRLGGGMVTIDAKVINQDNVAVQKGTWTVLVMKRPQATADTSTEATAEEGTDA